MESSNQPSIVACDVIPQMEWYADFENGLSIKLNFITLDKKGLSADQYKSPAKCLQIKESVKMKL